MFGLVTGMMHSYLETRSGIGLWGVLTPGFTLVYWIGIAANVLSGSSEISR